MYCRSPRIRLAALTGRGGRWSVAFTGRGGRWSIACPPWANGRGGRRSVTAVPTGAQRLSQPVRNGCPNRSSSSFQTFHVNGEEPCEDGWEQAGFNTFKRVPERPVRLREGLTLAVRVARECIAGESRAIEVRTADETVPYTPHTHSLLSPSRLQTRDGTRCSASGTRTKVRRSRACSRATSRPLRRPMCLSDACLQ